MGLSQYVAYEEPMWLTLTKGTAFAVVAGVWTWREP
jgi:hypothetical protein